MPVERRHVAVECYGGGESGDIGTHSHHMLSESKHRVHSSYSLFVKKS